MANVIIIDDDELVCDMVVNYVEATGNQIEYANTLEEGLRKLAAAPHDVVFLDVGLPDGNGIKAIPQIRQAPGEPVVIIITGEGDPEGAELAINNGAWDYIQKPLSVVNMTLPLERALHFQNEKKVKEAMVLVNREGIIGDSPQFNQSLSSLVKAASCEANTLIIGETGTGKEQFAKAIHSNSARRERNFVVVDCAALPETLVESTLFGHVKGAFTSADKTQDGLVKMADQGTLFLDEVGELPLAVQKTFLRVLQERRFRPVGSQQEVKSNFRLIAATNRNLEKMVEDGAFREDLLFRLRSITINLPSLRERGADIKKLALHFMAEFCERYQLDTKGFSSDLLEILESKYKWPGNVRELASTIENLIVAADDAPTIYPEHLPVYIRAQVVKDMVRKNQESVSIPPPLPQIPTANLPTDTSFKDFRNVMMTHVEEQYMRQLMTSTQWDIRKACAIADLSRARIYTLLKEYGIARPRKNG